MVRKGRRSRGSGEGSSNSGIGKKFTEEDISDDEIDSFHDQRDEIILNGRDRRSKNSTNNDDPFDALATGSRSVLDVDEASDSDDDDEDGQHQQLGQGIDNAQKERRKKEYKKKTTTQIPLADDSSDDDAANAEEEEQDLLTGGWGSNKRSYYNTNDLDDLESDSEMDEDEKREMEVREVKKLQSRSRQGMIDDDFGLGDQSANAESGQAAREQRKRDLDVDISKIIQTQPAIPINPAELIAKVQKEKPELMALIGEYADMVEDMHLTSNRMKNLQDTNPGHSSLGLLHLHHQTLLSYVTSLAFYFYVSALRTDDSKVKSLNAPNSIQTRIIERLAKLKQGLSSLEDFGLGLEEEEEDGPIEMDDEQDAEENDENQAPQFLFKPYGIMAADGDSDEGSVSLGSLEDDELMQLDAEERSAEVSGIEQEPEVEEKVQKAEKKKKNQKKQQTSIPPPAPLAGLADILNDDGDLANAAPPAKKRKQAGRIANSAYDEYSEPTALNTVDEAEKDAKRRSLKFHTGHLDALDSRKKNTRQLDGDVDIPYRDKERSRLAVASTNANKAAKVNGIDASRRQLDADDFGEADAQDWRDVMDAEGDLGESTSGRSGRLTSDNGDADYYDLITSSRKAAKEAQKEDYDQQRASERFLPDDSGLEPGEHRAINRQIEKNRGLTQRRPKTARNPRVKKRQRYEQAQKKLSSRGPVYKGGQSSLQGGYGGEKSGISTHVVKSRQFA
jgi:U3 small nucleolar RNA-associated protein 3